MIKKLEVLEREIDQNLEKLLCHPVFLQTVSTLLNLNSYRKIFFNRALTQIWRAAQLPNKRDQERTLHLIHELSYRLNEIESRLPTGIKPKATARRSVRRKADRIESESVTVQ